MTLVIGVKCRDGIVIGADSTTTYGSSVEQEVSDKIQYLASDALIASAGAVGLIQMLTHQVRESWESLDDIPDIVSLRSLISRVMWSEIKTAMAHAAEAEDLLGEDVLSSALCSSLIALPLNGTHVLLRYDVIGQSEEVTCESPFVSIGSGDVQADPFLAFVKRVVWNNSYPDSVDDGIFGVLWALKHVIEVNAGLGVGGRPIIATLQGFDGIWEADIMKGPRLDQNLQRIRGAEIAVRTFLNELYADESNGSIQNCS